VDKKTGEILSYTNTALSNNPATHAVTALASSRSIEPAMQEIAIAASRARFTREATRPMAHTDLATVKACFRCVSDALDSPGFLESLTALPLDRVQQIRATFRDDYQKMTDPRRPPLKAPRATGNGGSQQSLGYLSPEEATLLCAARGIPPVPRPYHYGQTFDDARRLARARGLVR
jgi:hypothetical protein